MRLRATPLVAGLVVLSTALAGLAADDTPEDVLKAKGLRKSGSSYLLAGEIEVQKKLDDARAVYRQMGNALGQQRAYEQGLRENKGLIREMTQHRIALNQQLGQASTALENNRLVAAIEELTDRLNLMIRQENDTGGKAQVDAEAARRREDYIQAVLDLRQRFEATTKKYADLAADEEVKKALAAMNAKSKAKWALGPSRAYLANVKLVEKAESSVLTETVALRKEGGIFWLDVTFGKVTRPMAFDTGASDVVLPADLAAAIGLKPGPNDPTVRRQVADGSVVEAKQMTIPQMRVGKFTVKDVLCTVMPADKKDVPPLLGQTFQKHFTFKFSPDTGQLVLSRVEAPEAAGAAPPKSKSPAKGSARPPATRRPARPEAGGDNP